jgi:UDP-arabinose 4-epimerase
MPAVLVTGGAGYVGSHACKALSRAGFLPITYDNLSRGHAWAVKWGPLEIGDILDIARLDSIIAAHRPIAALHFAAYASVEESVRRPDLYYRNNLQGAVGLLEVLRSHEVHRIVFSSTCAIYGAPSTERLAEEHPQEPLNAYGASKAMTERVLRDYASMGLRSACLRYFNAAGADPELEIGEAHEPETHLIPIALEAALFGSRKVVIFGEDYPTVDGTCIRDYVHVSDLAEAHVKALERLLGREGAFACNLGTGYGASVLETIASVERCVGRTVSVEFGPRRAGDAPALVADASRARDLLDWAPTRSSLDEIVHTAAGWILRYRGSSQNLSFEPSRDARRSADFAGSAIGPWQAAKLGELPYGERGDERSDRRRLNLL